MEMFGVLSFLALFLFIGGLIGHSNGSSSLLKEIKHDCDRHGATYIKDIRYSCKQEDRQPSKEPSK